MKDVLLSVDCSNRWTCLGLAVDGCAVSERNVDLGRAQASRLPLLVEEILGAGGLKIHDLTSMAVAVGPGYFTGIRIGIAYAAALAFSLGIGVVPLSSLEATLRTVPEWNTGLKIPLIAASRELAFSSAWLDGEQVLEEKERTFGSLMDDLKGFSQEAAMWGVRDARLFALENGAKVNLLESPSGAAMVALASEKKGSMLRPDELRARYLREPGLGRVR